MTRTAVAAGGFVSERGIKMNVYDFDNTIYDGESFLDLFFFFFKKDPALVKYVPAVMSGLYKYTKGTINAEEALGEYSHIIVEYLSGSKRPKILFFLYGSIFDQIKGLNANNPPRQMAINLPLTPAAKNIQATIAQ